MEDDHHQTSGGRTRYTIGDGLKDALHAGIVAGGIIGAGFAAEKVLQKPEDATEPAASKVNREHPETLKPFRDRIATTEGKGHGR